MKRMYEKTTFTDPINLRVEMDFFMDGGGGIGPKGHYVILRHYLVDQKSDYHSHITGEGHGGPAYKFEEACIKTRRVPFRSMQQEAEMTQVGEVQNYDYIYYFRYDDVPFDLLPGDHIYELQPPYDLEGSADDEELLRVPRYARYRIGFVHHYRERSGRVEYVAALVTYDSISSEAPLMKQNG